MALDTTVGGANANSYATLLEFNTYLDNHPYGAEVKAKAELTKEQCLLLATTCLDGDPRAWTGAAATSTQGLTWPRTGMKNRNGYDIAQDVNPVPLKNAQCEYARQLAVADRTKDNSIINKGIKRVKASSVEIEFSELSTENSELVARSVRELNALMAMMPDAVKLILVPSWLKTDVEDAQSSTLLFQEL